MNISRLIFQFFVSSILLVSCGDSESTYITSIYNNTNYEIIVKFSEDSTILCLSNQETIIEEYWGGSVKKLNCSTPYIFLENEVEIIVDEGNKRLNKSFNDDNNWACKGEEDRSLVMVGSYYSKVTTTFTISGEDIEDVE